MNQSVVDLGNQTAAANASAKIVNSPTIGGWILVIGASSSIGRAVAKQWAMAGNDIILAGRDLEDLRRTAADVRIRSGRRVEVIGFDAEAFDTHEAFWRECQIRADGAIDNLPQAGDSEFAGSASRTTFSPREPQTVRGADPTRIARGDLVGLVMLHGLLPIQSEAQSDFRIARQAIDVNYVSAVSILTLAANDFEAKKSGFLCVFTSVAGDRGRQSNYVYGSTKAALTTFLQGLRNRLTRSGVNVLTVKPGFVDTAMTWGLPGLFLVATPEKVAADVHRAVVRGASEIYTPWFWRYIMLIIKSVPEFIFKRMKM